MTTKTQLIAQCKSENPTMVQTINEIDLPLDKAEYDKACADWADMKLAQEANALALANAAADKTALLERLGITGQEAALLLS
jgi:hypothetical protein